MVMCCGSGTLASLSLPGLALAALAGTASEAVEWAGVCRSAPAGLAALEGTAADACPIANSTTVHVAKPLNPMAQLYHTRLRNSHPRRCAPVLSHKSLANPRELPAPAAGTSEGGFTPLEWKLKPPFGISAAQRLP